MNIQSITNSNKPALRFGKVEIRENKVTGENYLVFNSVDRKDWGKLFYRGRRVGFSRLIAESEKTYPYSIHEPHDVIDIVRGIGELFTKWPQELKIKLGQEKGFKLFVKASQRIISHFPENPKNDETDNLKKPGFLHLRGEDYILGNDVEIERKAKPKQPEAAPVLTPSPVSILVSTTASSDENQGGTKKLSEKKKNIPARPQSKPLPQNTSTTSSLAPASTKPVSKPEKKPPKEKAVKERKARTKSSKVQEGPPPTLTLIDRLRIAAGELAYRGYGNNVRQEILGKKQAKAHKKRKDS